MGFALLNVSDASAEVDESIAFRHRPVDLAHLSRHSKGNTVEERELLEVFRRKAKAHLDKLRDAKDNEAWRDAANLLKTSARSVGAWQIVNSAGDAERIAMTAVGMRTEMLSVLEGQISQANAFIATVLET